MSRGLRSPHARHYHSPTPWSSFPPAPLDPSTLPRTRLHSLGESARNNLPSLDRHSLASAASSSTTPSFRHSRAVHVLAQTRSSSLRTCLSQVSPAPSFSTPYCKSKCLPSHTLQGRWLPQATRRLNCVRPVRYLLPVPRSCHSHYGSARFLTVSTLCTTRLSLTITNTDVHQPSLNHSFNQDQLNHTLSLSTFNSSSRIWILCLINPT
jgi:hypothetical protein